MEGGVQLGKAGRLAAPTGPDYGAGTMLDVSFRFFGRAGEHRRSPGA